ncbi:hypothetical protein GCM10025780_25300 [Frondihabitans cladoniiphilus]|uniref:Uncharacterized protein n=2 Tax=Frondihabitans cladoniiphilus TaxID=715785 RepID=A0ABP8W240_9MICO
MAEYRVEPDCLLEMATRLSAGADSGPPVSWPSLHACCSPTCDAAFDEVSDAFGVAWQSAETAVMDLVVGAVRAADAYREVEARTAVEARRAGEVAEGAAP